MDIEKLNEQLNKVFAESREKYETNKIQYELEKLTDGDFLYLAAEEFLEEELEELTDFCIALKNNEEVNITGYINSLADTINRIMTEENIQEMRLSDDGFEYAICSLEVPNMLKVFGEGLNQNELVAAINTEEIFKEGNQLRDKLIARRDEAIADKEKLFAHRYRTI